MTGIERQINRGCENQQELQFFFRLQSENVCRPKKRTQSDERAGAPSLSSYRVSLKKPTAHQNFVRQAAETFFRDDGTMSNSGLDDKAAEQQRRRGRSLFRSLMNLPGSDETGALRQKVLLKWIRTARTEAQQLKVAEATDVCIGQWIARSSADDDGMWPAVFVCEA